MNYELITNYKIAIPTYKRAETLKNKTLALLQRYKINPKRIYIFVADEREKAIYEKELPEYYKEIIVGKLGLNFQRNFIQDYFAEGEKILNMDDDIELLQYRLNDLECEDLKDLEGLIEIGFNLCVEKKCSLWGIYPLINPLFMHNDISFNLQYIVGAFWGVINTHDLSTYVTMNPKEDFERTIKFYIKDKKVIRFNNIGLKTIYYTEAGGLQAIYDKDKREKATVKEVNSLLNRYPMFCERNKARKKHLEIRLVDKRKRRK